MKSKTKRSKNSKLKSYPSYYLAFALCLLILLEGFLIGATTPAVWQESAQILDISSGVNMFVGDFLETISPMLDQITYVQNFYESAADATIALMDQGDADVLAFPKAVNQFYHLASIELADMLDLSDEMTIVPQVAGAAIFR